MELNRTRSMLRDSVTFLPLKDLRFADHPTSGHTWFMSSMNDTVEPGEAEYLHFPSEASSGRVLCLSAHDDSDGSKNSYALAWLEALPRGATLLPGLTFVSDTYYDYSNLWHGLSAVLPFAAWHQRSKCAVPARWVLFHWGELRRTMGRWVWSVAEAAIGNVVIEMFDGSNSTGQDPACFEEAVVFRHNKGAMSRERDEEVFDMLRCKARAYCKVGEAAVGDPKAAVRTTLLLRSGARSFKNESAVIAVFERECRKVDGCRITVARPDNLTFCDQVKLLSETDVLVSPHGAQITNMFFMDKDSSIMEFYPKGWKELAGAGQYVFRWMAEWAGMRHQGSWWEPDSGELCPSQTDKLQCFFSYKDLQIGHDEAYFARWASRVLGEVKERKTAAVAAETWGDSDSCQCG
ncbi:uncharacterized protein LOC109726090 [Ananas comosus]|nr:uncharacterized protein LOC109726090 [Ananas comosus]